MDKNKRRRNVPASQIRAIERYKADTRDAARIKKRVISDEGSKNVVAINVPTVVRRVVEIIPTVGADNIPDVFQQTIDKVSKQQRNANRITGVLLFNRVDGRIASETHGFSGIDLFERVKSVVDRFDDPHMDAEVAGYSILGAKKGMRGMRFVSAILDEDSRRSLEYQANIIRESVGLEPKQKMAPYHFSIFSTIDQQEAESVLAECRSSSARYCIELAIPHIRTVTQRDGPPQFR